MVVKLYTSQDRLSYPIYQASIHLDTTPMEQAEVIAAMWQLRSYSYIMIALPLIDLSMMRNIYLHKEMHIEDVLQE